jgi:hypothetical protein
MPDGRPSSYRAEYVEQALKLCRLGATDRELADFFDVAESTLNLWKLEHAEFSESLKKGKAEADAEVADKLFQRATGYSHEAVKIFMPAGASEPVYAPYTEHYAPDPTSCIFWLKNRQPGRWRDVQAREVEIKQELSLAERKERALRHLNEVFAEPPVVVGGSKANGADH